MHDYDQSITSTVLYLLLNFCFVLFLFFSEQSKYDLIDSSKSNILMSYDCSKMKDDIIKSIIKAFVFYSEKYKDPSVFRSI